MKPRYIVVDVGVHRKDDFEEEVSQWLARGATLQGNLVVYVEHNTHRRYAQALLIMEEEQE